ncbi:ARM repeat-containing protein [Gonapodya prolifera JEL478]|uniref:ARM repeat-containing protein n=1 Tax=Gonapodya prolifera (strain JEL478) TaxID=1344416 RepID=A0A139AUN9_GONPJ|nr:ARM repeat-containing protein [Gonapodya prolifera JEL478]|eukprot:KXS20427.1 ARM repeat-containing protein [Gonapodya prolifera JEL478]
MCGSAKVRSKVRQMDGIPAIVGLLNTNDNATLISAAQCINNLAEDASIRGEITKQGGISALCRILDHAEPSVAATAAWALARTVQDVDARIALVSSGGIPRLVHLLRSPDMTVCRNAAWALSNSAGDGAIAMEACKHGALEALLVLSTSSKNAKFAVDALEKLLNFHLSAKFWLRDHLTPSNIIQDGFYDAGSAGPNPALGRSFPTLDELRARPADKFREVLLVDAAKDAQLATLVGEAKAIVAAAAVEHDQGGLPQLPSRDQGVPAPSRPSSGSRGAKLTTPRLQSIMKVAALVCAAMGGLVDVTAADDVDYKFKIAELKLSRGSNVVHLGDVQKGTFYHRALLFKVLADRAGIPGVGLWRGEYGRGWCSVEMTKEEVKMMTGLGRLVGEESDVTSGPDVNAKRAGNGAVNIVLGGASVDGGVVEVAVLDLMFEPVGKLMRSGSVDAERYQRVFV